MGHPRGRLERWSHGRGGRAALILAGAHLAVVVAAALIWLLGSLPAFDQARWLPIMLVTTIAVAGSLGLVLIFGFWGTPDTAGHGGGEDFERTFSSAAGYALGWLRWLLQIIAICGLVLVALFTWGDAKPWQIFGTEAAGELRERVDALPVPEDWDRLGHERDVPASELPRERHRLRFDVPTGYSFDDLRAWITGPEWADGEDGRSFGPVRLEYCDPADSSCRAHAVPAEGVPRIFVYARLSGPSSSPRVEVQVTYREPEDLAAEAGEALLTRFGEIPAPEEWVGFDAGVEEGRSTRIGARYGVPEDFGRDDLEHWLDDAEAWADFGELTRSPCKEAEDDTWVCPDIKVDAYAHLAGTLTADEFLSVAFDPTIHVVSITLRTRNA